MSIWPPSGFSKNVFYRLKVKICLFVTVNIITSYNFPGNSIEIPQVVQKIWRFSSSILAVFIKFLDFLTFPCYEESNDVSIKQIMPAFFLFSIYFK